MESYFDKQAKCLYNKAEEIINTYAMLKANKKGENFDIDIPQDFKDDFFKLVDKVNLSLMEDKDNFYGYFLFQTLRDIRFDISSPTAVNFKGAKYVIYFNPIIFLSLDMKQMESTIKHEILHILSLHLLRGKEFLMFDLYSFDKDEESMMESYKKIRNTYFKAFKELKLDIVAVAADNGAMGGKNSEEIMALSRIGEDTILFDSETKQGLNIEVLEKENAEEYLNETYGIKRTKSSRIRTYFCSWNKIFRIYGN